jgi:regulator of protease activity HflC (stomatin/prohibitin superfamily)
MADGRVICGICCTICLLLTGLIVLLVSIGTVEPIDYAIEYNSITKKTNEDDVYDGGWYLIGPFNSFFTFPATLVNIDWSDFPGAQRGPLQKVKDSGGQDITLSFSIQYKLNDKMIGKLYAKYKQDYERQFITWADAEVRTVVGKFSTTAFWSERAASAEYMRKAID